MPKGNGYQSSTPPDLPYRRAGRGADRTVEMHHTSPRTAWPPTGITRRARSRCGFDERYGWLRLLMDGRRRLLDARGLRGHGQVDIFQDEVFVFTPKGDVRSLPAGSTAVDFAYRVHTAVGHALHRGQGQGSQDGPQRHSTAS